MSSAPKGSKILEKTLHTNYNKVGNNPTCHERSLTMTGKEKHKVSASIQIEDGKYVVRGRVYDPVTGKIRHRSKATGFKVKGNRRRAEEKMKQIVSDWQREANSEVVCADPLFSESVALWLDNKSATLRESTITAYKYNINGHILPHFGNMRTREITRHQIRVFYSELLKKLSPQTVKKIHIIVLGAMEEAVEDGIISDNPAAKIKLPKSKKYVGFAYTEEQVSKLLDDIRADEEPMRSAITLALV